MNNDQLPDDDEIFMAQFKNRLNLEPTPNWSNLKKPFVVPWLELGWAFAGTLLLSLHWVELRFGFVTLHSEVSRHAAGLSVSTLCIGAGAVYGLVRWLGPKLRVFA